MIRETPKPRYSLGMESGVLYFWPKAHFSLNLWTDDHEKQSFKHPRSPNSENIEDIALRELR